MSYKPGPPPRDWSAVERELWRIRFAFDAIPCVCPTINFNSQTGTAYTLTVDDPGQVIEMNNASANTVTVPTDTAADIPTYSRVQVIQYGGGTTTIEAASGVTINGQEGSSADITDQYGAVTLIKRDNNEWLAWGDIGSFSPPI